MLNPIVELNDDGTATSRSTFCVIQDTETVPMQPIVVGRYFDTVSRDDSGWYFTERKVEIQMIGDVSAHLLVDPRKFDRSSRQASDLRQSALVTAFFGDRRVRHRR